MKCKEERIDSAGDLANHGGGVIRGNRLAWQAKMTGTQAQVKVEGNVMIPKNNLNNKGILEMDRRERQEHCLSVDTSSG